MWACFHPLQTTGHFIDRLPSHLKAVNIQMAFVAEPLLKHTNFEPLSSSDSS